MARKEEIKLHYEGVRAAAGDLRKIADEIAGRDLRVSFSKSKGAAVTQMERLAEELRQFGAALAELVDATARAMDNNAADFQKAEDLSKRIYAGTSTIFAVRD